MSLKKHAYNELEPFFTDARVTGVTQLILSLTIFIHILTPIKAVQIIWVLTCFNTGILIGQIHYD